MPVTDKKITLRAKKYFSDVYLIDPEFKVSSIDAEKMPARGTCARMVERKTLTFTAWLFFGKLRRNFFRDIDYAILA